MKALQVEGTVVVTLTNEEARWAVSVLSTAQKVIDLAIPAGNQALLERLFQLQMTIEGSLSPGRG